MAMTTPNLGFPEILVDQLPRGKDYKFNELVSMLDTLIPDLQPADADLTALAALSGTGFPTRTGTNTWAQRTITGTANKITVSNGNGVSGNPTITIPDAVTLVTPTVTGNLTVGINIIGSSSNVVITNDGTGGIFLRPQGVGSETGQVQISNAGVLIPSAGQIAFPAAENTSTDANTLDDYEEGVWTPTMTFATPGNLNVVYTTRLGRYTKVGRFVNVEFIIVTSTFTHTTAVGELQITGLPFNVASAQAVSTLFFSGITAANYTQFSLLGSGATMVGRASGQGQVAIVLGAAHMPTGGAIRLQGMNCYSTT